MSIESILQELKKERDQLDRAIAALTGMNFSTSRVGRPTSVAPAADSKKRAGGITAAGRKKLSDAMKKRWAERRKKSK